MPVLDLRPAESCRWDLVALGEVMLRLDPGEGRIATTRSFRVWEGGGEYNVARGLRRVFGLRTALVSALADNPVGRLVEDLILQGGVDQSHVRWVPYDGVGRTVRNGLSFTERVFGVRGAVGCSDRGHTAVSQLRPGRIQGHHAGSPLGQHERILSAAAADIEDLLSLDVTEQLEFLLAGTQGAVMNVFERDEVVPLVAFRDGVPRFDVRVFRHGSTPLKQVFAARPSSCPNPWRSS